MPTYFTGLDLGQSQDFSALVTLECTGDRFDARHIHRWELGTPYPTVVEDLRDWFARQPLHRTTLVVDATGVGRPVVDMIAEAGLPATVEAFTITAGFTPGDKTVPKKDLVGSVQAALQTRRLRFAASLPLRPVLERELETFRVKVTADRNETFSAWRERDHDDLVLALALALWYGETKGAGGNYAYPTGKRMIPAYLGTMTAKLHRR